MTLLFRTFEPNTRQTKTLSEKMSSYSLTIILFFGGLYLLTEKILNLKIPDSFYIIFVALAFILHFGSLLVRLNEFESLDGTFSDPFKLGEDAVEFEQVAYFYKDMSDFQLKIVDYYGEPTHNHRYGPAYKNGTSNYLSFVIAGEKKKFYFEIKAQYFITAISYHLIDIICNEKLPFQNEYLKLIPNQHKDFIDYRDFIIRLKAENRL